MLYTDEDKLTAHGAIHVDAHRKPDFCPDNLRSGNYICHLSVIRRTLLDAIGGLRPAFDGSQDHDLMLRACERADGVIHIPRVLYTADARGSMSTRNGSRLDAAARAVEESMRRNGFPGTCRVEDGVLRLRYDVGDFTVAGIAACAGCVRGGCEPLGGGFVGGPCCCSCGGTRRHLMRTACGR